MSIERQAHSPANSFGTGDRLYLVDGSSYIFRAYHALPALTRRSDGLPVGAVAGYCNMLWRLLCDGIEGRLPTHLAVLFDHSGPTFRADIFDAYKANRPEPPEDLRPQFSLIRSATEAFGVPAIEQEGYEADDLIATYADHAASAGAEVVIIASDKDLMQLVGPNTTMFDTMKDRHIAADEVVKKFGVGPDKVVEVQALAGDPTDNIPGIPGIGIKTAAQLINEFGDVEALLASAHMIKQPKRRQALIDHAESARISYQLVKLDRNVPVIFDVEASALTPPSAGTLVSFLKAMEFTTLTRRVAQQLEADAEAIDADPTFAAVAKPAGAEVTGGGLEPQTPAAYAQARAQMMTEQAVDRSAYVTIDRLDLLEAWIARAYQVGKIAIDTETTGLNPVAAQIVGISMAVAPGEAGYIPLRHHSRAELALDGPTASLTQLPLDQVVARLKPVLEDRAIVKIGQNIKYDLSIFARIGIDVAPYDDTMLMSYCLDAGRHNHGMDELSQIYFDHKPIAFKEMVGTGKKQIGFDQVAIDQATSYAAEDADITLRLESVLRPRLAAERVVSVYERLERPMAGVLAAMERDGVRLDQSVLTGLSDSFGRRLREIETELERLVGRSFNPASPKQIGEILFGELGLPGAKKTASGAWATGADVLEELAAEGHQLPAQLLAWRQLAKLKSTYTDSLASYINGETGRVHTSFSLAATITGRLSSSDPNLQNIPIRTNEGRKIRSAFIADPGNKLLSADYSQIELRVLAHIADIGALKQAFADGLDIHAMTASEMFGVAIADMDPMVRRRAKAINFGIIYGISAFGLAAQLNVGRSEAAEYIRTYFERFPGIRDYMEETKALCRENGFVTTMFGRKCHYPDINTKNAQRRAFYERAAINAPIQGSAADIIRRAMISMPRSLSDAGLSAKMLLQVHDELVFELPTEEVEATIGNVVQTMERACWPALELSVPLVVSARAADHWGDAH